MPVGPSCRQTNNIIIIWIADQNKCFENNFVLFCAFWARNREMVNGNKYGKSPLLRKKVSLARVTKININLLCQCIRHSRRLNSWTVGPRSGYFSEASLTFHNHLKRGEIFVIYAGNYSNSNCTHFWGLTFDSEAAEEAGNNLSMVWAGVEAVELSPESFPAGRWWQLLLVTRPTHVCLKSMRCFSLLQGRGKWRNGTIYGLLLLIIINTRPLTARAA